MEENKSKGVLNAINPKKKVAPKKVLNKDEEAKAKVEELLKNTSVAGLVKSEPTKPEFNVEEIKQERSSKWMEEQIELLNTQVTEQENEILFYKNEIQNLQNALQNGGRVTNDVVSDVNELSPNLVALFRHFENVYEQRIGGDDPMIRVVHPESGHGILDKFLEYIPQLNSIKRYRYRGNRMMY
jgi:hypothetical protein